MLSLIPLNSSASVFDRSRNLIRKLTSRLQNLQTSRFYVTEVKPAHSDSPSVIILPRLKRIIKTLDPSKYVAMKQDLHDISGGRGLRFFRRSYNPVYFTISRFETVHTPPPFPGGTKGALYYYRNPELPAISGEIRFRVFSSLLGDNFEEGYDLQVRPGRPWVISLIRIVKTPTYTGLLRLLQEEELVDNSLLEDIGKLPASLQDRLNIFRLDQPFLVDLEHYQVATNLVTRAGIWKIAFPNLFSDRTVPGVENSKGPLVPYKGLVWVRFEVSHLAEHAKRGPCLVLRFLHWATPLTPSIQNYTGVMVRPQEGELLRRGISSNSRRDPPVWCYPLQERRQGDKLKAFIAATENNLD